MQGCGVWEMGHGEVLPCPLPCRAASSSGRIQRRSWGSQGRGWWFWGWEALSWGWQSLSGARPCLMEGRGARGALKLLHCSSEPGAKRRGAGKAEDAALQG